MSNNHAFKIMSLNLLTSGARLPGNPPFSIRIHAIQSMLQEYDPDIIGVQELTSGMFPYMSNILVLPDTLLLALNILPFFSKKIDIHFLMAKLYGFLEKKKRRDQNIPSLNFRVLLHMYI